MLRPLVVLVMLVMGLAAGLWGCAPAVRVATDATFAPFHYVDDRGVVTGFDVELARAALERAGVEQVQIVRVESYAALFTGLDRGSHDVVAATTGITPQRQMRYGFSRPYFTTCQAVLVRDSGSGPASVTALAGRRIAASAGTTSVAAARAVGAREIVETTSAREGLTALETGTVDAVIVDEFDAVALARETPDIRVLPEPAALERYGFVLRREDVQLRRRIDRALGEMEADGSVAALRARFNLERPADWPITAAGFD